MRLWIVIITAAALLSPLTVYGATYEKDIKPIIDAKCSICHVKDAPTMEEFQKDKEKYKKCLKVQRWTATKTLL